MFSCCCIIMCICCFIMFACCCIIIFVVHNVFLLLCNNIFLLFNCFICLSAVVYCINFVFDCRYVTVIIESTGSSANVDLAGLRAFRVLRALKSISVVPGRHVPCSSLVHSGDSQVVHQGMSCPLECGQVWVVYIQPRNNIHVDDCSTFVLNLVIRSIRPCTIQATHPIKDV